MTKPTNKQTKTISAKKTKKVHDIFEDQDQDQDNNYHDYDSDEPNIKVVILANLLVFILIVVFSPIIITALVVLLLYIIMIDFIDLFREKKGRRIHYVLL